MKPEQYWISLGENVIGQDVLRDGVKARQGRTYQWIAALIMEKGIADVLDVGCNVAALAHFLHRAHFQGYYTGTDTNPHALKAAQAVERLDGDHYNVGRYPEDLRNLTFDDQWIECVVVKDVIEHLESYEPLAEAFRVAGKYVIVATYIPWSGQPAEIVRHPDGYYTNRYNQRDILALAERCGFTVLRDMVLAEANGTPNQIVMFRRQ